MAKKKLILPADKKQCWMLDSALLLASNQPVIFLLPAARKSAVTTRTTSVDGCWQLR